MKINFYFYNNFEKIKFAFLPIYALILIKVFNKNIFKFKMPAKKSGGGGGGAEAAAAKPKETKGILNIYFKTFKHGFFSFN